MKNTLQKRRGTVVREPVYHVDVYDKKESAEIQKLFDNAQTCGDVQNLSQRLNAFQQSSISRLNYSYIPRGTCEAMFILRNFRWSDSRTALGKNEHKLLHEAKKSFELGVCAEAKRERAKWLPVPLRSKEQVS